MRDFFDQVDAATNGGLYYIGLLGALAIPDLCGAMQADDGIATKPLYIGWFDDYVGAKYEGLLTGADCYDLRCGFLHQGRLHRAGSRYARVIFLEPGTSTNIFHKNVMDDVLNIDVRIFCNDMTEAARNWLRTAEDSDLYRQNIDNFLKRHPEGLAPYIVGVPVIG